MKLKKNRNLRSAVLAVVVLMATAALPAGVYAEPVITSRTVTEGDITTTVTKSTEEEANFTDVVISTQVTNNATGERYRTTDGTFYVKPEAVTVRTVTTRSALGTEEEETKGTIWAVFDRTAHVSVSRETTEVEIQEASVQKAVDYIQAALALTVKPADITSYVQVGANVAGGTEMSVRLEKSAMELARQLPKGGFGVSTAQGGFVLDEEALGRILNGGNSSEVRLNTKRMEAVEAEEAGVLKESEELGDHPVYQFSVSSGGTDVQSFGGGNVTVTLPCGTVGTSAGELAVYRVDEKGNLRMIQDFTYHAEEQTVSFETDELSCYAVGREAAPVVFIDVRTGDWYRDAVVWLAGRGIVKGVSDIAFGPEENVTRAEFVQILYNKNRQPEPPATPDLADVKTGDWYAPAVRWAAEQGVAAGTRGEDGALYFQPDAPISRQDMAVILSNYLEKVEQTSLTLAAEHTEFADASEIGEYARAAVEQMQAGGIVSGAEDGSGSVYFRPQAGATRAEAASMLAKLFRR